MLLPYIYLSGIYSLYKCQFVARQQEETDVWCAFYPRVRRQMYYFTMHHIYSSVSWRCKEQNNHIHAKHFFWGQTLGSPIFPSLIASFSNTLYCIISLWLRPSEPDSWSFFIYILSNGNCSRRPFHSLDFVVTELSVLLPESESGIKLSIQTTSCSITVCQYDWYEIKESLH